MDLHLTLNEEISWVMRKKKVVCNCNPCSCSDDAKERYFSKVKSALEKHNWEYLFFSHAKFECNNTGRMRSKIICN